MQDTKEGESLQGEVLTEQEATEELNRTRQVEAVEKGRPFFTVRLADGELQRQTAGHTRWVDYDNGSAKALVYIALDGKQYSLGNPSRKQTQHNVNHHDQLFAPIVDAGFNPINVVHAKGDSQAFVLFQHPEVTMDYQISWDHEQYAGSSRGDDGLLHLSVAAWGSPALGKSIRYTMGFFRSICDNGLVSTILGMGSLRLTHNAFVSGKVNQFAIDAVGKNGEIDLPSFSPRVLDWPIKLLDRYQREPEATLESLPEFVRQPFSSALATRPNWMQDEMLYQMNMAMESQQDLTSLDVLNLITNVNNAGENDSLYFQIESISQAFMSLLEVSAFRMSVEFPSVTKR